MRAFRICKENHQNLDGEGARLFGGRWNSPGLPVIYTSEHASLCVLEQLVHLDLDLIPDNWVIIEMEIPEHIVGEKAHSNALKDTHKEYKARYFGDKWLLEKRSLFLSVPSIIVPQERNILLNPQHVQMQEVLVKEVSPFVFDPRFAK